jgi:iron complex outermembrane recepter protein
MRFSLLILFVGVAYTTVGQNVVSGVITDEDTGEPIAFANVFFANTRIGVSSDVDGKFMLERFPSGKYDLTIAYVGYTTYQQALEFNNSTA